MSRRNTTKRPPRTSTLCTVIEALEPRAMLAGVGPESWSAPGLVPAPLGTGSLFSSGIILTCSSPTPGSSGTSSPPAPAAGSGGTTSSGDLWLSYSAGSGAASSSSGASGGSSSNLLTLLPRYDDGSNASGPGNAAQYGGSANTAENVARGDSIQNGSLSAPVGFFTDESRARAIGGGIGMVVGTAAGAVTGTLAGAAGGTLALPGGGTVAGAGIGGLEGAAYGGAIGGMMGIYLADLASALLRKRQEAAPPVNAPAEKADDSGVDPVDVMTEQQKRNAVESLAERILEHQKKLADYAANPDAYDNKDFLKNAPSAEVRERIISGRIRHLQNEIKAFEDEITRLLGKR